MHPLSLAPTIVKNLAAFAPACQGQLVDCFFLSPMFADDFTYLTERALATMPSWKPQSSFLLPSASSNHGLHRPINEDV